MPRERLYYRLNRFSSFLKVLRKNKQKQHSFVAKHFAHDSVQCKCTLSSFDQKFAWHRFVVFWSTVFFWNFFAKTVNKRETGAEGTKKRSGEECREKCRHCQGFQNSLRNITLVAGEEYSISNCLFSNGVVKSRVDTSAPWINLNQFKLFRAFGQRPRFLRFWIGTHGKVGFIRLQVH